MIRRRRDRVGDPALPEPVEADAVVVAEHAGLVILDGASELVAELISSDPALRGTSPTQVSGAAAAGALAQLGDILARSDTTQLVFELDEKGMEMFRQGALAQSSTGDGWLRAFGKGADNLFSGQAAIKPLLLAPQEILTAQLAITTVALAAAIKQVQEAVERVEAKVDVIKDLALAAQVGSVVGAHRSLQRRADQLAFTGSMSDTDWNAIDDLGVQVEQQIETLLSFIRKRLRAAEDEGARIADRRDAISYVEDLAETLSLLVVAQDSLYLYQQLRLLRIRDREPHLLPAAITEANELIEGQRAEDHELLGAVRTIVSDRVEVKALEIHRFISARAVGRTAGSVDRSLDSFASHRTLDYETISIPPIPSVSDAYDELKERSSTVADGAKRGTSGLVNRVRRKGGPNESAESTDEDEPAPPELEG